MARPVRVAGITWTPNVEIRTLIFSDRQCAGRRDAAVRWKRGKVKCCASRPIRLASGSGMPRVAIRMAGRSNFHEELTREGTVSRTSDRRFGVLFAILFALIGLAPLWRHGQVRWWSLAVSGLFCLATLVAPRLLAPLNYAWFRFGLILHRIVSPLMMAVIFYGLITPVGLLQRLAGKDPLRLKSDPASSSYWIPREPRDPAPDGFPRMY